MSTPTTASSPWSRQNSRVRKAAVTSESLIAEMWRRQEALAEALDKLWQRHIGPAVNAAGNRRSGWTDAARGLERKALSFGRRDDVEALIERFTTDIYILGALHIQARDRTVRERGKLPPAKGTIRVDKANGETNLIATFDLSLVDRAAIDGIKDQHLMWLTTKGGAVYTGGDFAAVSRQLIEEGKSGAEIAEAFKRAAEKKYGVGTFAGRGASYWSGVAEHAATTAGIAGQLNQLVSLGWTRYVVVNPMDERTTPVCQMMNGKTVVVSDGVANLAAVQAATTPDEVRAAKPFVSGGSPKQLEAAIGSKLTPGAMDLSAKQSKDLSAAGLAMPPYHFRCRSFIDISFEAGDVPPGPTVEEILPPAAPELPAGGFPFPLDQMKIDDSMRLGGNNPKFVLVGPDGSRWMYKDYTAIQSEFRVHVDVVAARVQKAAGVDVPDTFGLQIPRDWKGWGTSSAQRSRNTYGSVTKLIDADDVKAFDLKGIGLEDLTAVGRADVQIDHAVNWLISNGDAHYENFILMNDGRVVGIDKAQGFKFFGRDRLAIDYVSPQAPMPSNNGFAYAEFQLQRYANAEDPALKLQGIFADKGKLTEFGKRIKAMQDIPDEEYRALLKPYVDSVPQGRGFFSRGSPYAGKSADDVLDAMVARKNNLVADFDKLYKDIERQRKAKIPSVDAALPEHSILRRGFTGHVEKAKLAGYQVFHGGADLENLGLHSFRMIRPGQTGQRAAQIHFKGRLTKRAAAKLDAVLTGQAGAAPQAAAGAAPGLPPGGTSAKAFFNSGQKDDVLTFAKSFNAHMNKAAGHHVYDGVVPDKTADLFEELVLKFEAISEFGSGGMSAQEAVVIIGYEPTEVEIAAAKHYSKWLAKFSNDFGQTWKQSSIGQVIPEFDVAGFKPPKPTPKPKPKPKPKAAAKTYTARKASASESVLEDSWITADGPILNSEWGQGLGQGARRRVAENFNGPNLGGYVIETPKNKAVQLRVWGLKVEGGSRYSTPKESIYHREIRLVIDKAKPTKKDYADALKLMQDVGIDIKDAGPTLDEFKVLWAKKQAESSGFGFHPSTRGLFENIPETLPPKERLKRYADAFDAAASQTGANHLRWDALTRGLKDEDYLPFFEEKSIGAVRTATQAKKDAFGLPAWKRVDLDEQALKDADIYGLYSSVTGDKGGDHAGLIKIMFDNDNAAMIATEHRTRMGIPVSGMSPEADIRTGGAAHVFTRMRGSQVSGRYQLDGDELQRRIKNKSFRPERDSVSKVQSVDTGIYWKRKTMLTQDALSYHTDLYGETSSADFISNGMWHSHKASTKEGSARGLARFMTRSNNEHIIKGAFSITENVEFWVVKSQAERREIITYLKGKGVKKFGDRKIEEVFVVR